MKKTLAISFLILVGIGVTIMLLPARDVEPNDIWASAARGIGLLIVWLLLWGIWEIVLLGLASYAFLKRDQLKNSDKNLVFALFLINTALIIIFFLRTSFSLL